MEVGDNSNEAEKTVDIDGDDTDKQKPESTSKMKENSLHEKLLRRKHRCIENHWDMSDDTNSDVENKENVTNNKNVWSVNQNILNKFSSKCGDESDLCHNNKTEGEKVKFTRGFGPHMSAALKSSVENLMQYAEILYKCKLCTTLPSILTSKDTFLSHVSDQHLGNSELCKECSICKLKFGTEEDLRAHQSAEHLGDSVSCDSKSSGSGVESDKNDKLIAEKHIKSCNSDFSEKVCSDQEERDEMLNSEQCHDNKPQEHPKLVIAHGEMRNTPTLSVCENITKLQKLTDQILASNKKEIEGARKSASPAPPFSLMTPNYTAEFGKYTKLVREGGNIVYFCQLCNWKTQVKLQFQGHCTNSSHINKVKAASQNDNEAHSSTGGGKSSEHKGQITSDSRHGDKEYKEPVGWTPRGHMSFLTETSGFYISHSQKQDDNAKDLRNMKHSSVKYSPQNSEGGQMPSETEKDKENLPDKPLTNEKIETKLNKRKRSAPVVLRNQSGCEDGWGSDELDNDSIEIKSPSSPLALSLQNSGGKKRLLENVKETNDRISVDKGGSSNSPPMSPQTTPSCGGDNVGGELREITPLRMEGRHFDKEQVTPKVLKEEDLERTTAMIKQYFENQLGFRGLDQPLKTSSDPHEWPIPGKTFLRNGNHGHNIATPQPSYSTRERVYLYTCSLCDFGCHDIQDYRLHFENEHSQNHDVDPYESVSDGRGESWKMWKIKELLPDLICVYPRGNVSRDLLLQKISVILNIPEVVQWGPACNKAVREQFPHSLAQRKGKYKKTFFFGVTLLEQLQEQDDVSDGEGVQYQPLRDMSQDMEKILGHLHSLVQWTGNMESGISRDEILELLKGRIEEPDVQHWGVQCNRAIRVLFPNVEMKRKGKYKTTVFFGVDFRHDIHKQTFIPNKRGRPRKSPYLHGRDPDEILQRRLNWLDTMRTSGQMDDHSFLDISNHGESRSDRSLSTTRGWGPGSLFSMVHTYNSRDNNESPVMFMYDTENPSIKMRYQEEEDSELSPPDFRNSEYLHRKSELFNNDRFPKQSSSNSDKFTMQSLNLSFQDNATAKERFKHGSPNSGSSPKPDFHASEKNNFGDSSSPGTSDYSRSKLFNVHNLCQSSAKEKEFKPLPYPLLPLPPIYRSCYGDEMKDRSPYKFRPWSQSVVGGTFVNDDDEDVEDDDEGNKSKVDEDESGDGDDEDSNDAVTSLGTKLQKTRWRTSTDSKVHRQNQDTVRAGYSKFKSGNLELENSSDSDATQDARGHASSTKVYQKREHSQYLQSDDKCQNSVKCDDKDDVQNSDIDNCVKTDTAENASEANAYVIEPVIGGIPNKQKNNLYQKCSSVSEHDGSKSFNHSCSQIVKASEPMLIVEEQSCTSPKT